MYGILDNLNDDLGLELNLPYDIFAESFNEGAVKEGDAVSEETLASLIYTKEIECPVCRAKIENTLVRESKLRLSHMEELRPVYRDFEPLCYDVTMCTTCGYAALKDRFEIVSDRQREALLQKVRMNYANFMPVVYPAIMDEKMGIERYKYALLTGCVKKVSLGERAMLLTKISWLYKTLGDTANTHLFTKHANDVLTQAYESERFPIFGMSEATVHFLLARFATNLGDYSRALRFLSLIIVDQSVNIRLRDLARDMKEEIGQVKDE
ncbi:MAG: DUF2225 domain-containing protein [Defluviitaleaceae bacterium]|nr:DUF2225 domain-containing protein [Defluviitaleaceae bacterium]